jgi:hypothetical protein
MKLINVVEMNLTKESKQLRFNFTTLSYKTVKIVKPGWNTLNNLLN